MSMSWETIDGSSYESASAGILSTSPVHYDIRDSMAKKQSFDISTSVDFQEVDNEAHLIVLLLLIGFSVWGERRRSMSCIAPAVPRTPNS